MSSQHHDTQLRRRTPRDRRPDRTHGALDAAPTPVATPDARLRACVVVGTRPEAIKMAPVISALRAQPAVFDTVVVTTSQHREMLQQAFAAFGLTPHVNLQLMSERQTLAEFTSRALRALSECFAETEPDVVLVQGDTTTVLAAAMAAHYLQIPVGHVEAGLRSGNTREPFPEETNRRLVGALADLHFAPTELARQHLLRENVAADRIFVTGNTIVDALQHMPRLERFEDARLNQVPWEQRTVLVTVHRRENHGEPLRNVCAALCELARRYPDLHVVLPVHLNPSVREIVLKELGTIAQIHLFSPLGYADLLEVIRRSAFVLTDSGGIQEECPSLRKAVLVLRRTTERPEVIDAGFGRLVGTDRDAIVSSAVQLLDEPDVLTAMTAGENPFGDGRAAQRIAELLRARLVESAADGGAEQHVSVA